MWKKIGLVLLCSAFFLVPSVVSAETSDVKTVTRTEKKVSVECPQMAAGNAVSNGKINAVLSKKVADYTAQAATLGGGKVHYDVHKCDSSLVSLSIVMTPKSGVEESTGLTFERATGNERPLSYYYKDEELLNRAADGLKYLYDVDASKVKTAPDTYYVDSDNNIIGIYHAGAILDKSEGEIEVNLSAADPVIVKESPTPPPTYTGSGTKGTVTGVEVRMRGGAGTSTAILGYFEKGEVVEVLKQDVENGSKWYQVKRTNGATGWISSDFLSVDEGQRVPSASTEETKKGIIKGTEVRMRSDPSLNADVLEYFRNGEEVIILDATSSDLNWLKVRRANGKEGWVAADYCKES